MQAVEQKTGVAGALRQAYHSVYGDVVLFVKTKELEEALVEAGIPFRDYGSLLGIEVENIPEELKEIAQQGKEQFKKIIHKKSNRNKPISNKNSESKHSEGGAGSTTVVRLYESHYNIIEKIVGDERFRQLVRRVKGKHSRVTTSIKVDGELWQMFRQLLFERNLEVSEVLEELILLYVVHATQSSTTSSSTTGSITTHEGRQR